MAIITNAVLSARRGYKMKKVLNITTTGELCEGKGKDAIKFAIEIGENEQLTKRIWRFFRIRKKAS